MKSPRAAQQIAVAICTVLASAAVRAAVATDGSLGSGGAIVPAGGNYAIPASLGRTVGANLFQSFSEFNLLMGESATFSGPNGIARILARVTGGPSTIDGTIRSTIDGAHLFLINPQGIVFQSNAAIDVKGSFTATTADYVKLGSNGRFDARDAANDVLTSEPVSAWGFLPASIAPMPISVAGSTLSGGDGATLSFIGGDISFDRARVSAPGGRFELASFNAPGEYAGDLSGVSGSGFIGLLESDIDLDGAQGGSLLIRGGSLTVQRTRITSTTTGAGIGGDFDVRVAKDMKVIGTRTNSAKLLTSTSAGGRAGNVVIRAGKLVIEGEGSRVGSLADIATTATAQAGRVDVQAGQMEINSRARLESSTNGAGQGNVVAVKATALSIRGDASEVATGIFSDSTLLSADGIGGAAGGVQVRADTLRLENGGLIESTTSGLGRGGNVNVAARDITITAPAVKLAVAGGPNPAATGIFADTGSFLAPQQASGQGGNVFVSADHIRIEEGGLISTKTVGLGAAGNTEVQARSLEIARGASSFVTGIAVGAPLDISGPGGNVTVKVDTLRITNGQITASTEATGKGGNVSVTARSILLDGSGPSDLNTGILSETTSSGAGGNVTVVADTIRIIKAGRISTLAAGTGQGGDIVVRAGSLLISGAGTPLFTGIIASTLSEEKNAGAGGRLSISAGSVRLVDAGGISATSLGRGDGGSVQLSANQLTLDRLGAIEASAVGKGVAGSVTIDVIAPLVMRGASSIRTTSAISSAGQITIRSASDIDLGGASSITVTASLGNAGQITLSAPGMIYLHDGSAVLAEAGLNGGNVSIFTRFAILSASRISANAILGAGGNILIVADSFLASESPVTASSEASVQGSVVIQSPDAQLANALTPLPAGLIGTNVRLSERCAIRLGADFSSFLVIGRGGMSIAPGEPAP
ncbi:MAG: filamentous hemagglutinin N-terminal domain-containing protein [Chthoniobacteraceae bacterium]